MNGLRMKVLFRICFLLILTASIAGAQPKSGPEPLDAEQIREAEHRLSNLGYWTGPVDGRFDPATRSALIAFQKLEGRPITGQLTIGELEAIRNSGSPRPRELGYRHVEVDLDHQVLLIVTEDSAVRILPVSTGTGKPFLDEGQTSVAYTPRGRFLVYRKGVGWESGPLGSVYYPNDISGGVAIHGSRSVPSEPASHGCIRIPMFAAREVSKVMPVGTIVLVYDKVSFVSAKEWAENPKLKETALTNIATDDDYVGEAPATKHKSLGVRKPRPKVIRA